MTMMILRKRKIGYTIGNLYAIKTNLPIKTHLLVKFQYPSAAFYCRSEVNSYQDKDVHKF